MDVTEGNPHISKEIDSTIGAQNSRIAIFKILRSVTFEVVLQESDEEW